MTRFIGSVIANIVALWLSIRYINGVSIQIIAESEFLGIQLTSRWQIFLVLGLVLAILNYFLKPILNLITFPLRILSLGFIGLIINMLMIWLLSFLFSEFSVQLFAPLFWTTLIMLISNILIGNTFNTKK